MFTMDQVEGSPMVLHADRAEGLNQDVPPYDTHPAWLSPKNLDERAQGDGSDAAQSRRDACLQDMDVDSVRYPPLQRR